MEAEISSRVGAEGGEMVYDCIIVGAGPGGLQAGIHLGRYNFSVMLFSRAGGRTSHARQIENFLGHRRISGRDLVATGLEQAAGFGVRLEEAEVEKVDKQGDLFEVTAGSELYRGRFVIAASGGKENYPDIMNLDSFFGRSYFTCLACDGYRTTGKKLLVIENSVYGVRLSIGMKQLFTDDVTFLADDFPLPEDHAELLADENIPLLEGKAEELLGGEVLEGVRLSDGRIVPCEVIMGGHGFTLNDGYLRDIAPDRDSEGSKIRAKESGESSIPGLFAVGALVPGHSQAIVSAGQGAKAALEISSRLVEI